MQNCKEQRFFSSSSFMFPDGLSENVVLLFWTMLLVLQKIETENLNSEARQIPPFRLIWRNHPNTHHYVHVGQSELGVEAPPVDGTHILQSSEGRHCDGPSNRQNWQAVGEPSINPFLTKTREWVRTWQSSRPLEKSQTKSRTLCCCLVDDAKCLTFHSRKIPAFTNSMDNSSVLFSWAS